MLPLELANQPDPEAAARDGLEQVGLGERMFHYPNQLSGGEQQRIAVARAVVGDPKIILADEPTGNLDSRNGEAVMALLSELNRAWQRTVIVATHSSLADQYATRQINLRDGRIADQT